MDLSKKILNVWFLNEKTIQILKAKSIYTLKDLLSINPSDLLEYKNLGLKTFNDIIYNLKNEELDLNITNKEWLKYLEINPKKFCLEENQENNITDISPEQHQKFNTNILEKWPLSKRIKNSLISADIIFLGDLIKLEAQELKKLKNFGNKSLNEIKIILEDFNLQLGTETGSWSRPVDQKKERSNNNFFSLHRPLFKNPDDVINKFFKEKKIFIEKEKTNEEVEDLILNDIKEIFESLKEKYQIIFIHRLAYQADLKTLEELAKMYSITRERLRQLEKQLFKNIKFLGKVDKGSLVSFLLKKENVGFHKTFPKLDNIFFNIPNKKGGGSKKFFNTSGDSLIFFLEIFCGIEGNFFKPPERILMDIEKKKVKNIFIETEFPILRDFFIEEIKKNYGYNEHTAFSAFKYLEAEKVILNINDKIYPSKITKVLEVANIIRGFPEGLHWKEIVSIGNKSPTQNKWNPKRNVADTSITMDFNPYIYLSARGKFKHLKYLSLLNKKNKVIEIFIDKIKKNFKEEVLLLNVYQKVIKEKEFNNLDFFEARAIIKIFGEDLGLFHKGKSGNDILNLTKNFSGISITSEIYDIISKSKNEISVKELEKIFSKKSYNLSAKLNLLVDQVKIFHISPGLYLNYEDGINLCDINEVEIKINEIISNYNFLTDEFLREFLNDSLGYNLSSLYYGTIYRILAKKNSWYYSNNYLSNKFEKTINLAEYIKKNYDHNKDTNENFYNIAKLVALSKKSYDMIIYNSEFKYNDSWMNN